MLCVGRVRRRLPLSHLALSNRPFGSRPRRHYVNRSVIRLRVRDFSGAIADCDQSIQRWPQLSEPYVNRGAALINMERPQEALKDLDLAINMGLEKVHLAYYNRGLAKEKMSDARGAYADYRKALELDPNFTLASEQLQRFLVNGMRARHRRSKRAGRSVPALGQGSPEVVDIGARVLSSEIAQCVKIRRRRFASASSATGPYSARSSVSASMSAPALRSVPSMPSVSHASAA
jgi:tetratricopeptide (TPR) repeat protein